MGNDEASAAAIHFEEGIDFDVDNDAAYGSTKTDASAMRRMGRKQELVRHFRSITMFSFGSLASAGWESCLLVLTQSLIDGGRPNAIYSLIWTFIGFLPIYLSMAEMSSMAPIAGAQYHWVSEFAPDKYQKILSYLTGWTSTLAWQAGNANSFIVLAILVKAIITVNIGAYSHPDWHVAVLSIAFVIFTIGIAIFGAKAMPYWQNGVFLLHITAFLTLIVPIWVNAPQASHRDVWVELENKGGWPNLALAVMVGQAPGIYAHVGLDTATHMAEEVKDAGRRIPQVMLYTFGMNMVLKLVTTVTLSYHITDVQAALDDPTGFPGLWVMRQSMSVPCLTALLTVIIFIFLCGSLNFLIATNRDLYAFARDRGMIFSNWISKVDRRRKIPINAYLASAIISAILSLIYIGSTVAFAAIASLTSVALIQCYMLSIGCVLWRRIYYPKTMPPAQFSLGRWGIPVNASAVLFSLWSFFWSFWPEVTPITMSNFNWAPVIFVVTLLMAFVYYVYDARNHYHGPVTLVEGRKRR